MRFALDSNIILYAEGLNDTFRRNTVRSLLLALEGSPVIVPVQAIGEALNVMIRKAALAPARAFEMLVPWRGNYILQETSDSVIEGARDLIAIHKFPVWDAIIAAAASHAGAEYLLTEDMQEGFTWNRMTITNPFLEKPAPIIRALLNPS